MSQEALTQVLRQVDIPSHPAVLAGVDANDDAGVYLFQDALALVQTVDFFTPVVDDGESYGQIAAANALSDCYAMGARPLTALNVLGYPPDRVPSSVVAAILNGGSSVVASAGCALIGGHTIRNPEPIYGLVVTAVSPPDQLLKKDAARPGDSLLLTKPLGTGIITTAAKNQTASAEALEAAITSMRRLNTEGLGATALGVLAATDITGFGLVGHLASLCEASGCAAELWADRVPTLHPDVEQLAAVDAVPSGTRDNRRAADAYSDWGDTAEARRWVLTDAQTSGGLLLCVPGSRTDEAVDALHAAHIGTMQPAGGALIRVRARR